MEVSWSGRLALVVDALHTDRFAPELVAALRSRAVFDHSVMFAYCGDARPLDLYDNFPHAKRRIFVSMYQDGPYMLDPFFLACARRIAPGLYRLRDLAPDRFYKSEYFRSYYVQTGLSEEIGYFVDLPGAVTAVISLMRADATPSFSTREFAALGEVHPLVTALARQHWADIHRRFSAEAAEGTTSVIQRNIDAAFRSFGRQVLTPRERDVVEYVLKGHSSDAIGRILGISPGTVRIHRKNIYAKLGINSQGELFSQFIRALNNQPV